MYDNFPSLGLNLAIEISDEKTESAKKEKCYLD